MLEIRLHTLLLIVAGTIGLIALPFIVRSFSTAPVPVHAAGQALPTPLPPVISATVRTDGRPLNLRRGPGLDFPVLGSAPNDLVLSVTGRNREGSWLRVAVPEGEGGVWVFAALTEIAGDLAIVPTAP